MLNVSNSIDFGHLSLQPVAGLAAVEAHEGGAALLALGLALGALGERPVGSASVRVLVVTDVVGGAGDLAVGVDGTSDGSGSAAAPLPPLDVELRRAERDVERLVLVLALALVPVFVLLLLLAMLRDGKWRAAACSGSVDWATGAVLAAINLPQRLQRANAVRIRAFN